MRLSPRETGVTHEHAFTHQAHGPPRRQGPQGAQGPQAQQASHADSEICRRVHGRGGGLGSGPFRGPLHGRDPSAYAQA